MGQVMNIGSTSIEELGGREFVVVRLMNPRITKIHEEHVIFEDMLSLVDVRELLQEDNFVHKKIVEF